MRNLIRRGSALVLPQVPLAIAVVLMLALISRPRAETPTAGSVWMAAVAAGLVMLALPVAERGAAKEPLRVVHLPGYREPTRPPRPTWVRVGTGIFIAALALAASFPPVWATVIVVGITAVLLSVVLALGFLRARGRPAERARITAALTRYGPRFVVYTGRRNDASYQLRMWLPTLEKLGVPYIVVVRHPAAVSMAAKLTQAPIICCPTVADLDCVVVDSIKVAFYVNMIAENTNFVLYRTMTHVYLGHGDSDKELSAHPAHAMFDKIFVAGPAARERYARGGVLIPDHKLVVVGRPQLVAAEPARQPVRDASPARVLVAPTWRGYNNKTTLSSLAVAPRLVQALIERGAEVIFRPHPFSWLGRSELASIRATDELLQADRAATGRAHVLAAEQRSRDIIEVFNDSDAMITDVGSVLVDYFVTGKPYAAVLPDIEDEAATALFPTTEAAYVLPISDLREPNSSVLDKVLGDLLRDDPLAGRRAEVTRHYLGESPRDDEPFLDAVRALLSCGPQERC